MDSWWNNKVENFAELTAESLKAMMSRSSHSPKPTMMVIAATVFRKLCRLAYHKHIRNQWEYFWCSHRERLKLCDEVEMHYHNGTATSIWKHNGVYYQEIFSPNLLAKHNAKLESDDNYVDGLHDGSIKPIYEPKPLIHGVLTFD